MKTPKITKKELMGLMPIMDAVQFHNFCDRNKIFDVWDEVTITNFNTDYYNVELPEYGLFVSYYNGVLEEIYEI
jgi:intein/homing endonuclease